jgi:hypothetical protein
MWPVPSTSRVDAWPSRTLPPRPPATAPCWSGPASWVRSRRLGWRAAAVMGPAWRACSAPRASWSWRSTGPTAPLAGGGATRTRSDAEAAARAVLAGQVTAIPKTGSHLVEMVRWLRVARATAARGPQPGHQRPPGPGGHRCARAPPQLRELAAPKLAATATQLEPGPILTTTAATKLALGLLGERWLGPGCRTGQRGRRAGPPDRPGSTRAAAAVRGRAGDRRGPAGCRRGQPRTPPQRGRVLDAVRRLPEFRLPPPRRCGIACTEVATAKPTPPGTGSWWSGCAGTSRPAPSWPGGPTRACPSGRSSGAYSAMWPVRSSPPYTHPQP